MRIGHGYDVHRFREDDDGPLRLGGIAVPGTPRLDGYSDGDALIHAVIDAVLGAAGEGDIGRHFPPGDPEYQDIDSRELLRRVTRLILAQGCRVKNVDATVIAERPRLAEHLTAMREAIASALGIEPRQVNVKATTNEGLDAVGAGGAIAVMAVALIEDEVP